jgi:hypothetical protein
MDDRGANKNAKPYSPQLAILEWLTYRTNQGRLGWKIEQHRVTAAISLPPLVHLRFDSCVDAAGKVEQWSWFSIRDQHSQLLRVESNHVVNRDTTLLHAANALFIAALKSMGPA